MVPPLHEHAVRLEVRGRSCQLGLLLLASQPNLRLIKGWGRQQKSLVDFDLSAEDEKALGQGMLFFSRVKDVVSIH